MKRSFPLSRTLIGCAVGLFVVLILLAAGGCATDPATGKRSLKLWQSSTNAAGVVTTEISDEARAWLDVAEGANTLNPTPSQPLVGWGLTGIAAVLSAIGSWKAGKKNGKSTGDRAVGALVRAIESGPLTGSAKAQLVALVEKGLAAGKTAEEIIGEIREIDWSQSLKHQVQTESIRSGVAAVVHDAVIANTRRAGLR